MKFIKDLGEFWGELQNQQAEGASELIKSKLEDLVSPFKPNYYKALVYKCRNDETQGLDNEFTLELQKVFVPLKIASNYSGHTEQDIIPNSQNQSSAETTVWDFLAANDKKLVILGRPGSGKTTLLRHLTLIYATKQQHHIKLKDNRKIPELIPVLFYLREIRNEVINQNPSLEILVEQEIKKLEKYKDINLNRPSNWVKNKLKQNQLMIMLDGLDEVADKEERQKVRSWVDSQMDSYQDTVFILTSRPNGYKEVESQIPISVNELEVQPFNREQIENFLQCWYLQTEIKSLEKDDAGVEADAKEQANNLIERIVNSRPLVAMAVNPLLLKMIATVHRRGNVLPGKRVELYKDICQILLEKRQRAKNILDGLTAGQKQSILQVLALKLMQNDIRQFTLAEAKNWISGQLKTLPKLNNAEEFIKHIRDDCGLLVEKEVGEYEFAHLSFQEYLAAVEISESNQEDTLVNNIDKTWWSETIRLYAAQAKDATNIVNAVINMASPSINAFLVIADYEEEGWRIDRQVRNKLVGKLDAGLESDEQEIFKLATEVKLARRLNNLVRVNEELEIDKDYITRAEYKLFLLETGYKSPQNWQNQSFPKGTAKNRVDGIRLEDANQFCCWLSLRDLTNQLDEEVLTWYRLPTPKERNEHQIEEANFDETTVIRLVRCKLPLKYKQLAEYLMHGEWKEADEETFKVMLKVANKENQGYLDIEAIDNFPCEDLRIIDRLWVSASNGKFGFSVQKDIYQSLGGKREYNKRVWEEFGDRVGWRSVFRWLDYGNITFNLKGERGHLPFTLNTFVDKVKKMIPAQEVGDGRLLCSLLSRRDL
ncbi:MAG: GUN4 domain-containing protein [Cyanobacteria bacterium P01_A01_bin.68]